MIYRSFPDKNEWAPAKNVARNPTTGRRAKGNQPITNRRAAIWAKLFNLRYWMLLVLLSHSFLIEGPAEAEGSAKTEGPAEAEGSAKTEGLAEAEGPAKIEGPAEAERPAEKVDLEPRGLLISWVFGEMYNLRSIAEVLMALPVDERKSELLAGPPFEMPYSLALSPREPGRWRQHRDLVMASQVYIDQLIELPGNQNDYVIGLSTANRQMLSQINVKLGGLR